MASRPRKVQTAMTVHAMPVMLGRPGASWPSPIATTARSWPPGSRRSTTARTTPAHELQRRPELPPDQQVGAVRPPLRGHLGRRAADRAGAGDPVRLHAGPALAGRRRLPGRRGAGHARAGRLVRRGGKSLAEIARAEIGPVAGAATAVAILFIVIIALAGLGFVVVKALGGEEVPMLAGHACSSAPQGASHQQDHQPRRLDGLPRPARAPTIATAPSRPGDDVPRVVPAAPCPPGTALDAEPRTARARPARRGRAARPRQLVGHVHHRLHDPDRAVRRPVHVPHPQGQGRRGVAHRRGRRAGRDGRRRAGSPARRSSRTSRSRASRRSCAIAVYGFVASVLPVWLLLCPRDYLSSFLKIGTIALLVVGVIVANPTLRGPADQPRVRRGGGPTSPAPIFPFVFICIMCGAISGFHALVSSGTTPEDDRQGDATSARSATARC